MVDTKKEPVRGKPAAGFSALVLRGNDSKLLDGVLDAAPDGNLAKSGFPTAWFDVGDFPPVLDDFAIESGVPPNVSRATQSSFRRAFTLP